MGNLLFRALNSIKMLGKHNENHDRWGRFSSGNGGGGGGSADGKEDSPNAGMIDGKFYDSDGKEVPPEAHYLAYDLIKQAKKEEAAVTASLQDNLNQLGMGGLLGLDFKIKSQGSLDRKVRDEAISNNKSFKEAAGEMKDVLKYTAIFNIKDYAGGVANFRNMMIAQGYKEVKFKNTWGEHLYQGINSNWQTKSGQVFELQFHTLQSFRTKEKVHHDYEEYRQLGTSIPRQIELYGYMAAAQRMVKNPFDPNAIKMLEYREFSWKKFLLDANNNDAI